MPRPTSLLAVALLASAATLLPRAGATWGKQQEGHGTAVQHSWSGSGWFHGGAGGDGATETISLAEPLQWESTAKGTIDLNGKPIHIKGINWNGLELPRPIISGLEERKMGDLLDILEEHKFNALRIPLSYEVITHMDEPSHGTDRAYVDPELRGKTLFQVLDTFVEEAGKRGILVMFDMHQIDPMKGFDPLWYTDKVSEQDVNRALSRVVGRYKGHWNFFAVDIKNEPHSEASWTDSHPATDFNKYAERTIVQLHREHPEWPGLFVVNGVSDNADYKSPWKHWWGANFEGTIKHPLETGDNELDKRIVYSPRVYSDNVYDMEYFSDPAFPERLTEVWDNQLAWLERKTGRAAIMGEYGGSLEDKDRVIQEHLVKWMVSRCIDDAFWWSFNPGSTDIPDGVIKEDWKSVDQDKLKLMDEVQPTPTKFHFNGNSLEVDRGAPANPQCSEGPTDAIRPTPPPSAAPGTYRRDPFEGMPPGTTSQDIRRMRRQQKKASAAGGTGSGTVSGTTSTKATGSH